MLRRPPFLFGLLVLAIIVLAGPPLRDALNRRAPSGPPPRTGEPFTGRARVVDGDSLELAGHRVRLFGIDAPERSQECSDARQKPYACGRQAQARLQALVGEAAVSCSPVGISYDRDVAQCTVNGRDLSEAMVRSGFALELRQHSHGRYSDAERAARSARAGLWAGGFDRPSDWRRDHPRR